MLRLKLYKWYAAIRSLIMKESTVCLVDSEKCYTYKNGSCIDIKLLANSNSNIIRGKRSKLYIDNGDLHLIDNKIIEQAINPYIKAK